MDSTVYCHVEEQRLNGYYVACTSLRESSAKLSALSHPSISPSSMYTVCPIFQMDSTVYCHVEEQRLNGYYVACTSLRESSAKLSAKPESLYRRAESARRNLFRVGSL